MIKYLTLIILALSLTALPQHSAYSMVDSIQKNIIFQAKGKNVKPLFSDGFKVAGIGLKKGQILEKHSTPQSAFLFIYQGKVEYRTANMSHTLNAGDFIKINPKEEHEIQAIKDSRLILVKQN